VKNVVNPPHRPWKYKPEELKAKIDAYFKDILEPKIGLDGEPYFEPVTITGLALACGTSRDRLCAYAERDDYSEMVWEAKLRVEHYAERQLYLGRAVNGPIFALKNFGWRDDQNVNMGGQEGNPVGVDGKIEIVHVPVTIGVKEREE